MWKPKYYESKPRIFVPRQIEVQRKVEVEGGRGSSSLLGFGDASLVPGGWTHYSYAPEGG